MSDDIKELPEDQLEEAIGLVGMGEYNAAPDYDKPKIRQWMVTLQEMSDEEFVGECASKTLDEAVVQSKGFRGNWNGVYARVSACYTEAKRRHRAAGHDADCRGDTLYSVGQRQMVRSQGHTPNDPVACTCGKEG